MVDSKMEFVDFSFLQKLYISIEYSFKELVFGKREFLLQYMGKNSVGAEIGVFEGKFAKTILRNSNPACLYLIDPWEYRAAPKYRFSWYGGTSSKGQARLDAIYHRLQQELLPETKQGRVKFLRLSSRQASTYLQDESLDWVYIDGDHSFDAVSADLELYFDKLKPGGYILGDDYHTLGWWRDDVIRAVQSFRQQRNMEIKIINAQYIIKKTKLRFVQSFRC